MPLNEKIKLYGFNNLTKTLSFNIYDICYAESHKDKEEYLVYIDEQYNSERLTNILCTVTEMIGAHVLNISKQDYEPQGASATMLITEEALDEELIDPQLQQRISSCHFRGVSAWGILTKATSQCIRILNSIPKTILHRFAWIST